MSMACCSTCISGFAAVVTLAAFIFDIVLFFVAKARINTIGHASIGNAIWLTLIAWVLLFFSGCFFTMGRCCISKRGMRSKWGSRGDDAGGPDAMHAEQMRMEAIKADNERRATQARSYSQRSRGLPAFPESVPLTAHVESNSAYTDKNETSGRSGPAGYAPAPQGSRAVDEYYEPSKPSTTTNITYTPRPERQASTQSRVTTTYPAGPQRQPSGYTPSSPLYSSAPPPQTSPPPPLPNNHVPMTAYQNPHTASGCEYGHTVTYSSHALTYLLSFLDLAGTTPNQQPSSYPYNNYPSPSQFQPQTSHYTEPSFNPTIYNSTGILNSASPPRLPSANVPNPYTAPSSNPYMSPTASDPYVPLTSQSPRPHPHGAQRQYTLGGDSYGGNYDSPLPDANNSYLPNLGTGISFGAYQTPINTNTGYAAPSTTSPTKQYQHTLVSSQPLEEAPPGYDAGAAGVIGHWGKHS